MEGDDCSYRERAESKQQEDNHSGQNHRLGKFPIWLMHQIGTRALHFDASKQQDSAGQKRYVP